PSANKIEVIGGGAAGGASVGGAGADYAKVVNQILSGSIAIAIGAGGTSGGNGGDTTFGSILLAKGGGSASADIGSTTYAGGTTTGTGGGGAAGLNGAGGSTSTSTGGTADNGTVAADASGTEWGTAGSGGGGSYASGPTLVSSTNGYDGNQFTHTITTPTPVLAGDIIVLSFAYTGGTYTLANQSPTLTDNCSGTYTNGAFLNNSTGDVTEAVFVSSALPSGSSAFSLSLTMAHATLAYWTVYVIRGATTGLYAAGVNTFQETTPQSFASAISLSYTIPSAGFVFAVGASYVYNNAANSSAVLGGATADYNSNPAAVGLALVNGHAAVSASGSITINSSDTALSGRRTLVLVPVV
ncbi:MAG: hypothetical protein B7X04_04265, partial [Parcubacteria group bacterium 21-54-25]